jgi:signal transduction histidine kinase
MPPLPSWRYFIPKYEFPKEWIHCTVIVPRPCFRTPALHWRKAEMMSGASIQIRAKSDAEDRLLEADEPLATLQLRCGGQIPGCIAVPELLALVRRARHYGLRLAQAIQAQDGEEIVSAWVEVRPEHISGGCEIAIANWQSSAVRGEDPLAQVERRAVIDRHLAELTARLDKRQKILVVESATPELQDLVQRMREGRGRYWTDFIEVLGSAHRQPLHWRLLDGASLRLPGSDRSWRASLVPLGWPEAGSAGFELNLVAEEPQETIVPAKPVQQPTAAIGREVAPVLRQPIARIIANAETIRTRLAGPLADEYSDYAADIASAGQHLLELLDDLSDLEVVEAENFSTSLDHIDLADVSRRAAGILGVRAQERKIRVDLPDNDESVPAIGEFRRVLQILLNLLGNAIRYAPEDSQIWIRTESLEDRARIVVADQGRGLSEEDQAVIFNKFERLGRSGDGGSGLGLYISRRLARTMRGDLTVESAPGQGARFVLELPADI